jgi:hypothetical protein
MSDIEAKINPLNVFVKVLSVALNVARLADFFGASQVHTLSRLSMEKHTNRALLKFKATVSPISSTCKIDKILDIRALSGIVCVIVSTPLCVQHSNFLSPFSSNATHVLISSALFRMESGAQRNLTSKPVLNAWFSLFGAIYAGELKTCRRDLHCRLKFLRHQRRL